MNPQMMFQPTPSEEDPQPLPQGEPVEPSEEEDDTQEESCVTCRFWEPKTQEGVGICHAISGAKKPPQVTAKGMLLTPADFYCSSFQPAEQPDTIGEPSPEELSAMLEELSKRQIQ